MDTMTRETGGSELYPVLEVGPMVDHPMTDPVRGSRGRPTDDPKEAGPVGSGPRLGHHLVA